MFSKQNRKIPYTPTGCVWLCLTLSIGCHPELWSSAPILCQEDANCVQQGSHEAFGFRVRIFKAGGVKKMHQLALDRWCDITGHLPTWILDLGTPCIIHFLGESQQMVFCSLCLCTPIVGKLGVLPQIRTDHTAQETQQTLSWLEMLM